MAKIGGENNKMFYRKEGGEGYIVKDLHAQIMFADPSIFPS